MPRFEKQESDLQENVVFINRVAKVVKGGRRFSFAAVVVVGDGKGRVGAGLGKAAEVPEAIRKGVEDAKKNMINVALKNGTIPHESLGIYGAGKVIMRQVSRRAVRFVQCLRWQAFAMFSPNPLVLPIRSIW